MKKRKKIREVVENFLCGLIFALFIVILFYVWFTAEPSGHYEGTETMQPDGNYYVWIEE